MADVNAKGVLTAPIFKNNTHCTANLGDLFCVGGHHQHERFAGNGVGGNFCHFLLELVRIADSEPYSVLDPYHCSDDHHSLAGDRG